MPDNMLAEKDGVIGWMIFNHPERLNAVTQDMWIASGEILDDFEKDDDIRVVVLKGAGDRAFVSGADISKFGNNRRNAEEVEASNRLTGYARQKLANFERPTIAMINGYCLVVRSALCGRGLDVRHSGCEAGGGLWRAGHRGFTGAGGTGLHAGNSLYRTPFRWR